MLPDDTLIRRTVRAATGRYPRIMPWDLVRGLSFTEICFTIRKGGKPRVHRPPARSSPTPFWKLSSLSFAFHVLIFE